MTNFFVNTYGSYVYGVNLFTIQEQLGYRHRQSKAMNRDGAFSSGGLRDPRRLSAHGWVVPPDNDTSGGAAGRALWDTFKAAHAPGAARPLFIDDDRYINAEVESTTDKDWDGLSHEFTVTFLCFDPFWYSVATNTLALSTSSTASLTTNGTAYSLPVITLIITAAPAGGLVTVANAQDATLTFAPPSAGTFTIDCLNEIVTDGTGVDQTAYFGGAFLQLVAGQLVGGGTQANSLTTTFAGGLTGTASLSWQDRWD